MKVWLAWPGFALVTLLALAGCGSNNSTTATITITPTSATILLNTSLQFIPSETGSSNAIQWSVNGIANGNATVGTISSTGLYTAPGTVPFATTGVAVPVIFCTANSSIPNSGSSGAVCELQAAGSNLTNFAAGNTITIANSSQAGWDGSFIIEFAATLSDGNLGIQIPNPAGPPATGTGGTATAVPNLTISAAVESTSAVASATVTLDSGVRVALSETTFTIGTQETFLFAPFVSVTGTSNTAVTWTVSTGIGTIDPNSGLYVAPNTTGTATIVATSVVDPSQSASATVTIVTAADPTLTSLNPPTGAIGAAFQEVFLSGTNFISTTLVFVNGVSLPSNDLFSLSSGTLLVVVPDSILSSLPTTSGSPVPLTFEVARQAGARRGCSPSACPLNLSPVRPALVAVKPDSIQQSTTSSPVTLNGGYFGTTNTTSGFAGNPVVSVQFNGTQANPSFVQINPNLVDDRQMHFNVSPGSPGLYPITVTDVASGSANGSMAAANIAVQPANASFPSSQTGTQVPVGAKPSSVAINTATGLAVVANQGTRTSGGLGHDIALIDLTQSPPKLLGFICTEAFPSALTPPPTEPTCPGSGSSEPVGPSSVSVDNLRNVALVANSGNGTLAVVDLGTRTVTALLSFPSADPSGLTAPFPLAPQAVAINPVSGRALVAFTTLNGTNGSNAGAILDMNLLKMTTGSVILPPAVLNAVNLNNGVNPHIAVSPRLNWALATPGGAGSLSIVDLGRQTTNAIASLSCSSNVVSVATSTTPSLQAGQPVLITGVANASFDGIFSVSSVSNTGFTYEQLGCSGSSSGGIASYANPVATVATNLNVRGVSINDETQKAMLVDPTPTVPVFVFDILDQSSTAVPASQLPASLNNVAVAMDPLLNIGLVVNTGVGSGTNGQVFVVDPVTPQVLPPVIPPSPPKPTFTTGTAPVVDVAIDPATSTAVFASQGDNSVYVVSLPAPRTAPQIVQASFAPVGSTQSSSHVTINSSLSSPATAQDQTVTLIGSFTTGSVPRLDGNSTLITPAGFSPTGCRTAPNICRVMKATISAATLAPSSPVPTNGGPRVYALDAADSSAGPSNAEPLQVIQAVNLATSGCSNPAPQGVAIDATHNVAVVTEPGCNPSAAGDVSMVSLSNSNGFAVGTGFGGNPTLAVGNSPQGVGVYPQAGLAVVANSGSNTVSVVDVLNDDVATTFTVDPIPSGVAINQGTGNAVVTASGASLVDTFAVSTSSQTPTTIGVLQGPTGVAIDPKNDVAVVADTSSSRASVVALSSSATTNTNSITLPQGVAFDPITDSFLITSFATNQVTILNPNSVSIPAIRVGIDPSSIAYNYGSGTLVTANNLSGTMTVVDFIDQTVRGLFSLPSSTQYAVDIHLQTNLVVVADTVDNQLLLVPLPH